MFFLYQSMFMCLFLDLTLQVSCFYCNWQCAPSFYTLCKQHSHLSDDVGGQKWDRPSPRTMPWSAAIECMVLEGWVHYMGKLGRFLRPIGFRSTGSTDAQQLCIRARGKGWILSGSIFLRGGKGIVGCQKWHQPSPCTMARSAAIECLVLKGW